jgi:hypothetical protein
MGLGGSVSAGGGYAGAVTVTAGAGPPGSIQGQGGQGTSLGQDHLQMHSQRGGHGTTSSPPASPGSSDAVPSAEAVHVQQQLQQQSLQHQQELSELQALAARAAAEAEAARTAAAGAGTCKSMTGLLGWGLNCGCGW